MKAYERVIRMIAHEINNTTADITSTLDPLDHTLKELVCPFLLRTYPDGLTRFKIFFKKSHDN